MLRKLPLTTYGEGEISVYVIIWYGGKGGGEILSILRLLDLDF